MDAQKIELVFDGTFKRRDGKEEAIKLTQPTSRSEAGGIRWTTFGPFGNPFTPKNPDIGVFNGKVGVKVTLADGTEQIDESPLPVRLEVKPSIIVTELQPTSAECDAPALRLIGGMKYKMKTQLLGFDATSVDYEIKVPGIAPDNRGLPTLDFEQDGSPKYRSTLINHAVGDTSKSKSAPAPSTDKIDDKDAILLPVVPPDRPTYGVIFSIIARDAKGAAVRSVFGMQAHNPLEVVYDGRYQLAQIYAAQPVSACMPGGQQGRNVDYTESKSETRSRSLSVTLSSTWLKSDENNWSTTDGKNITTSKAVTDGYSNTHSTTNSFTFERNHSETDGVSFNWSNSTEVKAEAKVGFSLFEVGGSVANTRTVGGERSHSTTNGWSQSNTNAVTDSETRDHSETTTDSTSISKTDSKGGSQTNQNGGGKADGDAWTVSSTDTIQRGFGGSVIAGTYGVFYRQLARYTQKAFVLEYNKCGQSDVVGDVTMQDYVWAPDLALSNACPPLPKTNFPAPQCYLPPCDPQ
jgi:hypothetical protein